MANSQLENENFDDDNDEMTRRNRTQRRGSTDGLEFVPTILKLKQMILLRHSDLLRILEEFNNTLETFTRDEQHYLRFTIVPHSDSTIFWKAIIRIKCSKVILLLFTHTAFNRIFCSVDFPNRSEQLQ